MVSGPRDGLRLLSTVEEQLAGHYRLAAVRGHLLEMAGDRTAALEQLRLAATRTPSLPERQWLLAEIKRLGRR
jgi:predicted RNA polymerase sigma factor